MQNLLQFAQKSSALCPCHCVDTGTALLSYKNTENIYISEYLLNSLKKKKAMTLFTHRVMLIFLQNPFISIGFAHSSNHFLKHL